LTRWHHCGTLAGNVARYVITILGSAFLARSDTSVPSRTGHSLNVNGALLSIGSFSRNGTLGLQLLIQPERHSRILQLDVAVRSPSWCIGSFSAYGTRYLRLDSLGVLDTLI